jgi:ubiquinol-cytochrome c reductase cytochrome c subunit
MRRYPRLFAVAFALGITGCVVLVHGRAQAARQQAPLRQRALIERGRELFLRGCSSCHGVNGQGLRAPNGDARGPSLKKSGAAGAYYYLHTGRMPLANSDDEPKRKAPAYNDAQMRALVAFVASLDHGPAIPDVRIRDGNLADGGELFRGNCAACHSAAGAGGALNYGRAAPSLAKAQPLEIGSAVRTGPGQMPQFDEKSIDPKELDSIARYVVYLHHPRDPGGLALGRIGPIPEGFVIWVFGMGVLLLAVNWIGKRNRPAPAVDATRPTASTPALGGGARDA